MNGSHSKVIGVDIGGANLKFATSDGDGWSTSFPMWSRPAELKCAIVQQLNSCTTAIPCRALAVTMTGELADCFRDRGVGVRHIVQHTVDAAKRCGIDQVWFYGVDGQFHTPQQAKQRVDQIAAANWHALASYVAKRLAGDGLLIDVGSTTTDLIPLSGGRVATDAKTDFDRLKEGSLVYVGCRRTPVCALVDTLPYQHDCVAVMNEVFATIDDAMLLLGHCREVDDETDTADGMPRTIEQARNRMARMIGLDHRHLTLDEAQQMAKAVFEAAKQRIAEARGRLLVAGPIILSGHGEPLAAEENRFPEQGEHVIRLADHLHLETVRCAPSLAVARLYETVD